MKWTAPDTSHHALAEGITQDLTALDAILRAAVEAANQAYGEGAASDPFRGLHIAPEDVARLLRRTPGQTLRSPSEAVPPSVPADATESQARRSRGLTWMAQRFDLSDFERDVLLVALAPEVDLRYERLYAYLQDDVTRRRPSVDLVLNLLCRTAGEKMARRADFGAAAPLARHGLVHLFSDGSQAPLLAHSLKLDEQVVRFLLGHKALDVRLEGCARLVDPHGETGGAFPSVAALKTLMQRPGAASAPQVLFVGPDTTRRRRAALATAQAAGKPLLAMDAAAASASGEVEELVAVALREACLHDAVLGLDACDALWLREGWPRVSSLIARHPGTVVLGSQGPPPAGSSGMSSVLSIAITPPSEPERRAAWEVALRDAGVSLQASDLDRVADQFRLTTDQIGEAAAVVWGTAALDGTDGGPVIRHVLKAARARSALDLGGLARRISPRRRWYDLVLPTDAVAQLQELSDRAAHSRRVLRDWGFDARLSLGKGVTALFSGPAGTGKTMAAEVVARELDLDLYKIDLSGVVSKWVGETEKNLDRIFRAAERGSGVLFFDEADALFGKRSEVRDSHDRYANVEIAYLLQRMEEHEGVALLATNLRSNLDDAFLRRLSFVVHFPFPDEASRLRIWRDVWPDAMPRRELDLARLAHELPLTGGNIRNVALAAAYLAASEGVPVDMEHVDRAVWREYQKMGKSAASAPVALRATS